MRFAALFFSLMAVASALEVDVIPRAAPDLASSIIRNLTVLANDSLVSNQSLNAQPPGSQPYSQNQLVAIIRASNKILDDLNSTAATANKSAVFTQAESQQIYNKLNTELRPIIFSVADNTIAHYGNLRASSQVSSAKVVIQIEKESVRELANALLAKVVPPYIVLGTKLRDTILAKYDSMITKFSS